LFETLSIEKGGRSNLDGFVEREPGSPNGDILAQQEVAKAQLVKKVKLGK